MSGSDDGRVEEPAAPMAAAAGAGFAETHYTYNVAGDLLEIRDPGNNRIIFNYNTLGSKKSA